jgi:chemotaxis protein methyltransferase CheR
MGLFTEIPFFMNNYNVEIGIVETRKIISAILEHYNLDYKNYALTFLKHRFEKIINDYNFKSADNLIEKIVNEPEFFEQFQKDLSVEDTEMFRDPSLWRLLRDNFFPKLIQENNKVKIWMVSMQSGEELYSMAILLNESNLWDKVEITATYDCSKNYELILNGIFDTKKIELNDANYKRFNCYSELSRYYKVDNINNIGYWDTSLIKNIKFIKHYITFENSLKNFNLVWFRNGMIYFNQVLQDKVFGTLYESLLPNGYMIIGDKETVEYSSYNKKFKQIELTEKIYKKL